MTSQIEENIPIQPDTALQDIEIIQIAPLKPLGNDAKRKNYETDPAIGLYVIQGQKGPFIPESLAQLLQMRTVYPSLMSNIKTMVFIEPKVQSFRSLTTFGDEVNNMVAHNSWLEYSNKLPIRCTYDLLPLDTPTLTNQSNGDNCNWAVGNFLGRPMIPNFKILEQKVNSGFKQTYKNGKLDITFIKIYQKIFLEQPSTTMSGLDLCYYTNGSLQGIIKRLKAVQDIADISRRDAATIIEQYKPSRYFLLESYQEPLLIPALTEMETIFQFLHTYVDLMENCEVSGNAYTVPIDGISIVEASSTGVWLDNLRTKNNEVLKNGASVKATVYGTMEVLFRRFTQELRLKITSELYDEIQAAASVLWLDPKFYIFIFFQCKNKSEVYDADDWANKTRSIFAANAVSNMMINTIITPASAQYYYDENKPFLTVTNNVKLPFEYFQKIQFHLVGLKPKGFAMKLVKHWRSLKPGQAGGFFMSDNLFLYWKNHKNNLCWQSWDGSKMEASHRHEDFLEYWEALTQIVRYSDPYEQAMISSLFMHMASQPRVLLGNGFFQLDAMPSGLQGTTKFNSFKMFKVYSALVDYMSGQISESDLVKLGLQSNIDQSDRISNVFTDPTVIQTISLHYGVVIKLQKEVIVPDLDNIPRYLELDLLGNGIACLPDTDYYCLVLEKSRLLKQLTFVKNFDDKEQDQDLRTYKFNATKLSKYQSAYITGAWMQEEDSHYKMMKTITQCYYNELHAVRQRTNFDQIIAVYQLELMKEIPDIIRELKLPGNYSNMPLFNLPDVFKIYVEDSMYKEIYDSYTSQRQQTGDLYLDLNSGFLNKCDIATTMEELGLDVEREDGRYVEQLEEYLYETSPADFIQTVKDCLPTEDYARESNKFKKNVLINDNTALIITQGFNTMMNTAQTEVQETFTSFKSGITKRVSTKCVLLKPRINLDLMRRSHADCLESLRLQYRNLSAESYFATVEREILAFAGVTYRGCKGVSVELKEFLTTQHFGPSVMKNFTQLGWIRFPSELNFPGVFSKVDDIYFGVPYRQYLNDRYDPIFVQIFLQLLRSTSYHYFIKAILNSSISRNFSFQDYSVTLSQLVKQMAITFNQLYQAAFQMQFTVSDEPAPYKENHNQKFAKFGISFTCSPLLNNSKKPAAQYVNCFLGQKHYTYVVATELRYQLATKKDLKLPTSEIFRSPDFNLVYQAFLKTNKMLVRTQVMASNQEIMAIRNGKPCMEAIKRMCTEFKPEKAWTEVYAYLTVCLPLAQQRPQINSLVPELVKQIAASQNVSEILFIYLTCPQGMPLLEDKISDCTQIFPRDQIHVLTPIQATIVSQLQVIVQNAFNAAYQKHNIEEHYINKPEYKVLMDQVDNVQTQRNIISILELNTYLNGILPTSADLATGYDIISTVLIQNLIGMIPYITERATSANYQHNTQRRGQHAFTIPTNLINMNKTRVLNPNTSVTTIVDEVHDLMLAFSYTDYEQTVIKIAKILPFIKGLTYKEAMNLFYFKVGASLSKRLTVVNPGHMKDWADISNRAFKMIHQVDQNARYVLFLIHPPTFTAHSKQCSIYEDKVSQILIQYLDEQPMPMFKLQNSARDCMSKTNYGDEYAREATRVVFDEIKYAIACTYNFYAFPIIRSLTPKSQMTWIHAILENGSDLKMQLYARHEFAFDTPMPQVLAEISHHYTTNHIASYLDFQLAEKIIALQCSSEPTTEREYPVSLLQQNIFPNRKTGNNQIFVRTLVSEDQLPYYGFKLVTPYKWLNKYLDSKAPTLIALGEGKFPVPK